VRLEDLRECLEELRSELTASYPAVSARALIRIARQRGLEHFPPGFLVPGRLRDRSARGPRAFLSSLTGRDERMRQHGHPLFSSDFYRLMNRDVAASSVSPWAHYQVFGRAEGRSPHPLLDHATLAAALPGVLKPHVFDEYLANPAYWFADPSPYVDVGNFVVRGDWDGVTHPFVQLSHQLEGPWVHRRLMLIDAGTEQRARARLVGAAYLLTRDGGRSRLGRLETWSTNSVVAMSDQLTVVPGFLLAQDHAELRRIGNAVLSPDSTLVRLREESIGLVAGEAVRTDHLIFMAGTRGFEELGSIIRDGRGAVIAPHDRAQEIALRQLRRDLGEPTVRVLEYGVQVRVTAAEVSVFEAAEVPATPEWSWDDSVPASSIAVVLRLEQRRRSTGDQALRRALSAGAALCLVDGSGLNSWLPVIQHRPVVLTDPSLLDDVASFVNRTSLRLLPATRRDFS
jgi:hypothetical protein